MITANGLIQLGYIAEVDFSLQNDGGDTYIKSWWSDDAQPTVSAIEAAEIEWQTAYDALDYSRQRKAKYDLLNQYEMIGDDATNGTTTHRDAIAAIKAAHPKP
tara:strand:- start:153 stop:461 length:309 start_codon:yes stop_codon:yes gene_type:complete